MPSGASEALVCSPDNPPWGPCDLDAVRFAEHTTLTFWNAIGDCRNIVVGHFAEDAFEDFTAPQITSVGDAVAIVTLSVAVITFACDHHRVWRHSVKVCALLSGAHPTLWPG